MERLECHDWDTDGFPGEFVYGDDMYVNDYYMDERWKRIDSYGDYWISDHGRVYGPGRWGDGDFVEPVPQDGYHKVTLTSNGCKQDKRVNRLVAKAFIPNPNNLPLVMHMDNDRKNNHVDNLKWGTHAENNQYCWDCGRHPETLTENIREKAMRVRRTPIVAINMSTGRRNVFVSQHDAARALGVTQQHIWGVLKGIRRSTGGYRFEYIDKEDYLNDDY
jgi:hypothetical protein